MTAERTDGRTDKATL